MRLEIQDVLNHPPVFWCVEISQLKKFVSTETPYFKPNELSEIIFNPITGVFLGHSKTWVI